MSDTEKITRSCPPPPEECGELRETNEKKDIFNANKYIHYKIESIITEELSGNDLTASQSHVLMFIMNSPGEMNASRIHREMRISRATVSGLIKKLRQNGYITLEGCDEDERRKRVIPTEKARLRRKVIADCMSRIEDTAFADLSESELSELDRLITKVAKNINKYKEEADT
ncbi:MAG: MarR family transcriptional regulator [Ruminococcus sp.]|nr:MarR family transcriptional regulator [Ruminococcus sp.]